MAIPEWFKMIINGEEKQCELDKPRWPRHWGFFVMGKDINGRVCRCGYHSLPQSFMLAQDPMVKVKTSGNEYQWPKKER